MNIGKLRRRVRILTNAGEVQDSTTGIMGEGWTPGADWIPAAIEPLSAREFIASASAQGRVSTRITVRYMEGFTDGISSRQRIEDDSGKVYSIEGPPLPDKHTGREYLTILCNELEGETA